MDHKKDIGNLFKNRFQDAEKAPDKNLWDRLDNSLEKRDKKRRVAAWLWYGSLGILLIALVLAGYNVLQDNEPEQQNIVENSDKTEQTEQKSENILTETLAETEKGTEENSINNLMNKTSEILNTEETGKQNNDSSISENDTPVATNDETNSKNNSDNKTKTATKTKTIKASKNDPYADEGVIVKTSYHYYNSDTDTASVSLNKQQLDSLVNANAPVIKMDSINSTEKNIPTIKQDSIYKN